MNHLWNALRLLFGGLLTLTLLAGIAAIVLYFQLAPTLPSTEILKDVHMQVPLRIYAGDDVLIGEYGEMKRTPLAYEAIPELMIKAVLAAEDDRFFSHPGVDYQGLLRAGLHLARTGEKGQGGSTITMQVARNFFLSSEKTFTRKLTEILLALKIDRELGKEEILELYLNKIFLGQRAYGVAVAAQTYYGKDIQDLTLAQYAMLAGLPKAPSTLNPVTNPGAALQRRGYVLGRMLTLGYISRQAYEQAMDSGITASLHALSTDLEAAYVAEMARSWALERYGDTAYTVGYKIYTTIDPTLQRAANKALRENLLAYDRRHGYRGIEAHVDLEKNPAFDDWDRALSSYATVGQLYPALVIALEQQEALVYQPGFGLLLLGWDGLSWARQHISENSLGSAPKTADEILQPGDVIRVRLADNCRWQLAQIPAASAALIALRPQDGALQALVGGFDFAHSKFNRVMQAERQPGSSFKPFVYAAALDKGFTTATVINDAPVVFDDNRLESAWRPENYSGRFYGPTRLRVAMTHSRNLVSVRVLRAIGIGYAMDYLEKFGFDSGKLPRDLSLSLGSGSLTPLALTRAYAVFANGGFLIEPWFIARVEDSSGKVIYQADPPQICHDCPTDEELSADAQDSAASTNISGDIPEIEIADETGNTANADASIRPPTYLHRVLDARTAYISTSLLQDVIRFGTGRQALSLGRSDLAGKTGTTNEQRDAWFTGYSPGLVATAWVGFDTPKPLGNLETGARAALPMWTSFMAEALRGVPQRSWAQPEGLVSARIDPETGNFTHSSNPRAIFELFRSEDVLEAPATGPGSTTESAGNLTEQLF